MKQIIGFANKFYTLWDYEAMPQYKNDSYGNHHQTGVEHKYYYIKNISTDINKVKALFPNVEIDTELRGTSSFTRNEKLDLPENYFWGGKYVGRLIDEIMDIDFKYCLWSAENYNMPYITNHSKYIKHFEDIEQQKKSIIESAQILEVNNVVELYFIRNGYNSWYSNNGKIKKIDSKEDDLERFHSDRCYVDAIYRDINITIECASKYVNGKYPYLMPIINNKAQKTKGKKLTVTVIEVLETKIIAGVIKQFIKVA